MFTEERVHMIASIIIVIGSINWVILGLTKSDIFSRMMPMNYARVLFVLVGLCGIYLGSRRDFYLPFLGNAVMPPSVFKVSTPINAAIQVTIPIEKPNKYVKLVYWAADKDSNVVPNKMEYWKSAYGNFENSGVLEISPNQTEVVVSVHCPKSYYVKPTVKKVLQKHIHYRFITENGMASRIFTHYIKC